MFTGEIKWEINCLKTDNFQRINEQETNSKTTEIHSKQI